MLGSIAFETVGVAEALLGFLERNLLFPPLDCQLCPLLLGQELGLHMKEPLSSTSWVMNVGQPVTADDIRHGSIHLNR